MDDPSKWVEKADGWDTARHYAERQRNGFSKADWINFDTYIAWVISSAVQKMKDDGHTCFYYPDEPSDKWEGLTKAEYDVMILGFGDYAKYRDDTDLDSSRVKEIEDNLEAALEVFKKRFKSLWD